jgi:hypothetical protein
MPAEPGSSPGTRSASCAPSRALSHRACGQRSAPSARRRLHPEGRPDEPLGFPGNISRAGDGSARSGGHLPERAPHSRAVTFAISGTGLEPARLEDHPPLAIQQEPAGEGQSAWHRRKQSLTPSFRISERDTTHSSRSCTGSQLIRLWSRSPCATLRRCRLPTSTPLWLESRKSAAAGPRAAGAHLAQALEALALVPLLELLPVGLKRSLEARSNL